MEGLFEAFVEAVISGLRLGYYPRKEMLSNNDFSLLERQCAITMPKRIVVQFDRVRTIGLVACGMLNRIADSFAVDIEVTIDSPRSFVTTY